MEGYSIFFFFLYFLRGIKGVSEWVIKVSKTASHVAACI